MNVICQNQDVFYNDAIISINSKLCIKFVNKKLTKTCLKPIILFKGESGITAIEKVKEQRKKHRAPRMLPDDV